MDNTYTGWVPDRSYRVNSCRLEIEEETNAYSSMSIEYSREILLVPGFSDACLLYEALKMMVDEKLTSPDFNKFHYGTMNMRGRGLTNWQSVRVLGGDRKDIARFVMNTGPLSISADVYRMTQVYSDICETVKSAGLEPDSFFVLPPYSDPNFPYSTLDTLRK